MKIREISEAEFNQLEPTRQIIAHDHPRKFALVDFGKPLGNYGISWRSPLVTPEIAHTRDAIWIGVDQRLAAIDAQHGNICISLPLSTPLLQILVVDNFAVILTELEILLFNRDRTLICAKKLPDLATEIKPSGNDFTIEIGDRHSLILTKAGVLKESIAAIHQ